MTLPLTRRTTLVAAGMAFAGCLGSPADEGPQERTYALTVTRSEGTLAMQVEPAGDVEDVIRVSVGDTVTFTIANEAAVPVGVHNHADDATVVVEPGATRDLGFEATEAMTGRHEIEGWVAEEGAADPDDHAEDATVLAIVEVRPRGS